MALGELPIRVYFQDTDSGGIVFHAAYLDFFERGRTEWLRSLGITQGGLYNELGLMFVVRKIDIRYLKPAFLDELLLVKTEISRIGKAQITICQKVIRDKGLLMKGTVNLGFISADDLRPKVIPDWMRDKLILQSAPLSGDIKDT